MLLAGYLVALVATVLGFVLSAWVVARSRQHADDRRDRSARPKAARWLLLCGSSLVAMVMAEAVAAAWLGWIHRLPALPVTFAERAGLER